MGMDLERRVDRLEEQAQRLAGAVSQGELLRVTCRAGKAAIIKIKLFLQEVLPEWCGVEPPPIVALSSDEREFLASHTVEGMEADRAAFARQMGGAQEDGFLSPEWLDRRAAMREGRHQGNPLDIKQASLMNLLVLAWGHRPASPGKADACKRKGVGSHVSEG